VLIIIAWDAAHFAQLFVRPSWFDVVESSDEECVGEILIDLKERISGEAGDNLFKKVFSLSFGPLLSYASRPLPADGPELLALSVELHEW